MVGVVLLSVGWGGGGGGGGGGAGRIFLILALRYFFKDGVKEKRRYDSSRHLSESVSYILCINIIP